MRTCLPIVCSMRLEVQSTHHLSLTGALCAPGAVQMKQITLKFFLLAWMATSVHAASPIVRVDYEGCDAIKDKDKQNYCIAVDKGNAEFCRTIGNSDRKNLCLAKVNNDEKACLKISDKKTKERCMQSIR